MIIKDIAFGQRDFRQQVAIIVKNKHSKVLKNHTIQQYLIEKSFSTRANIQTSLSTINQQMLKVVSFQMFGDNFLLIFYVQIQKIKILHIVQKCIHVLIIKQTCLDLYFPPSQVYYLQLHIMCSNQIVEWLTKKQLISLFNNYF